MQEAEVRVATRDARDYLSQLAQDWNHTYPVRYDALTGEITFPHGQLILTADEDSLALRIVSEDLAQLEKLKDFVATHVRRLDDDPQAFVFDWRTL